MPPAHYFEGPPLIEAKWTNTHTVCARAALDHDIVWV